MPQVALRLHSREEIALEVANRPERGGGAMGRLRRDQGEVPGVLYGHNEEPYPFKTNARALARILARVGQSVLFDVTFDDRDTVQPAIVREIQYHKVAGTVLHLDLLRIDPRETRTISVPIHTVGVPEGVRTGGGALQHAVATVDVECVIAEMPSGIEIDITALEIGDSIHVSDLLEQEPRIVTDPGVAIVSVLAPRMTIDEELEAAAAEEAEEGEEGVEGEEGEGEGEGEGREEAQDEGGDA